MRIVGAYLALDYAEERCHDWTALGFPLYIRMVSE